MIGVLLPAAVAVEVFDAGHLGRDVARRGAAVVALVALVGPAREAVACAFDHPVFEPVGAAEPEFGALARGQRERAAAAFEDALPVVDGDEAGLVVAVDPVAAGARRPEAALVGDELELVGRLARAQPRRRAAAVKLHRDLPVVQAQHLDFAAAVQAQRGRSDIHFGARVGVGREAVAGGQRAIALGAYPFAAVGAPQPHLPGHIGEPTDPCRRIDALFVLDPCVDRALLDLRLHRRAGGDTERSGNDQVESELSRRDALHGFALLLDVDSTPVRPALPTQGPLHPRALHP